MRYEGTIRALATGALLAATVAGAGCTWVRETTGIGREETAKRPEPPGLDKPSPNLATVPNRTPDTGTTRQRLQIEEGLLADRANARHVAGPTAGEERVAVLPPEDRTRPMIIDPRQAPPPGPEGAPQRRAAPPTGGPIGNIVFGRSSTALPEGSGRMIVRAAEIHRRYGGTLVVIGNSARAEGDDTARRAAALTRANTVAAGLVNLGVPRDQIRVGAGTVDAGRVDIGITGITRR